MREAIEGAIADLSYRDTVEQVIDDLAEALAPSEGKKDKDELLPSI